MVIEPKELTCLPLADKTFSISFDIADDDPFASGRFVRSLTAKMEWIAVNCFPGVPGKDLLSGLKALPFRQRCIYFRTDDTSVRIPRVLHGRRDLASGDVPESDTD